MYMAVKQTRHQGATGGVYGLTRKPIEFTRRSHFDYLAVLD